MANGGIPGNSFGQCHSTGKSLLFKQFFHTAMFPKMLEIQVHDRFARYGKPEMSRLNDSGMNRTHRHFEHAFPLNKMPIGRPGRLPFLQDRIPWETFL